MSIIPSQLQLSSNLAQIEQNHTVIISARVLDQFGNPLANQSVSLFSDHLNYSAPVYLTQVQSNVDGTATFRVELRTPGNAILSAKVGALTSAPVNVFVTPSTLTHLGPKSWYGVGGSLSRLETDLNTVIGKMITDGTQPTKEELCKPLGLDYSRAKDRNRISEALYSLKQWFDYLVRILYQQSPAFGQDFSTYMNDAAGYATWQNAPDSPFKHLKAYYGSSDDEIRQLWVLSRMWDHFVQIANQYNLHLFIAHYDKQNHLWRYKQPNFWEYVDKQIQSAQRLGKGMITILTRHRDLGMILTSGEPVSDALEESQRVRQMITERTAPKIRCVKCMRSGITFQVSSQDELADHFKAKH